MDKTPIYYYMFDRDSIMAYLSYRGSIFDQIRDDIKLDSIYRKKRLDKYEDESYDDYATDYDYDYTFDYAD